MATLTPNTKDEQDSAYSPENLNKLEGSHDSLPNYNRDSDGLDDHPISGGDSSGINSNDLTRDAEENPNNPVKNGFYRPSPGGKVQKITTKAFFKKKGPMATIIGLLLGGGGVFSIMFTPGIGIVQLGEVMKGDLNDQVAAMDMRTDHMFKAKLKSLQAGGSVCSKVVKIKCKFTTMNSKQVEKFKGEGKFNIETEDTAFGRKRIISMTAPDGTVISNPQELLDARKKPSVRSAINKVYNPIYQGTSDFNAKSLFTKYKINKAKALSGITVEEQDKSLNEKTSGAKAGIPGDVKTKDGREYILQGSTEVYLDDNPDLFNQLKASNLELSSKATSVTSLGVKAVTGTLDSGLKGVSLVGAADSVCTVYNTGRAIAAASKIARALQLAQFAMVFLNTADSIKAGAATPEAVEYIGNKLAATDTRKQIVSEASVWEGANTSNATAKPIDNPFYGKSAFDSPGYKVAAYNESPTLTTQSQQYMIGGGLSGTLSSVLDGIPKLLNVDKKDVKGTCSTVQSWWARAGGLIAGVVVGIGSFGVSTVASIGASVAIGFAMPFLQSALTDIVAGQVVNSTTKGVEAGDAIFSGSSALFGGLAQSRGLKPLNTSEIGTYMAASTRVKSDIVAAEVYGAKDQPFDIMNQYSFLGSVVRTINPTIIKSSGGVATAFTSVPLLLSTAFSTILPQASATSAYNPERFNKCNDEAYADLGISADVFCNVRYGLSDTELNLDTEEVIDYMLNGGYINENTGTATGATSDAYKNFLTNCVNREDGWGETSTENGDTGIDCMKDTYQGAQTKYFRVYTLDKTINDGMDNEIEEDTPSNTTSVVSSGAVLPLNPGYGVSDGFNDPNYTATKPHKGIDLSNYAGGSLGKPVYAVRDGEVIESGFGGSCDSNNTVTIQHADGTRTGYMHMLGSDITVKKGSKVTAGQQIGKINNCGDSSGAHLHFEVSPGTSTEAWVKALPEVTKYGAVWLDPVAYLAHFGVSL